MERLPIELSPRSKEVEIELQRREPACDPTQGIPDSYFRDQEEPLHINYLMKIYALFDIDSSQKKFSTRVSLSSKHILTRDQFHNYLLCKKRGEVWAYDHQWMWPYNATEVEYEDRFGSPSGKTQEWFVGVMGGKAVSFVQRFAKITWNADFNVRAFPFDSHALQMILDCGGPKAHIEVDCGYSHYFVKPEGQWNIDSNKIECFPPQEELVVSVPYCEDRHWDTDFGNKQVVDITNPAILFLDKADADQELQCARGTMTMFLSRNWRFFLWRVYFVMFVLAAMSVVVFLFDSLGDQFGFLATALLTTIAYLFYIGTFIPVMKYNTLMDKYIYSMIFFKFLLGFQLLCLGLVQPEGSEIPFGVRRNFSVTYLVILVAGHVAYGFIVRSQMFLKKDSKRAKCVSNKDCDEVSLGKKYEELLKQKTISMQSKTTRSQRTNALVECGADCDV